MKMDDGIKKLADLAEKRGYITYDDINVTFSDAAFSPEELDEVYIKLRTLDIEIVNNHFPEPSPRF